MSGETTSPFSSACSWWNHHRDDDDDNTGRGGSSSDVVVAPMINRSQGRITSTVSIAKRSACISNSSNNLVFCMGRYHRKRCRRRATTCCCLHPGPATISVHSSCSICAVVKDCQIFASRKTCRRLYNYTTALGFTVLVVSTLLGSCIAAPAKPKGHQQQQDPWWFNPCDKNVAPMRHSRSADYYLDNVRRQLRTFIGQLSGNINHIRGLYSTVQKTSQPFKGKLTWLKVQKMIRLMKPKAHKLTQFHEALQHFAGTLDAVNHIKIRTNATRFDEEKRKHIYINTTLQLKLLLCEVQDAIIEKNQKVPAGLRPQKMKIKMPKTLDLTGANILDLNFFTKMKNFFVRSQKLFKDKKAKTKVTSSDTDKSKSVAVVEVSTKKSPKKRTQKKKQV